VVSRPSVVTVSSFVRQKLIENMTRVSVMRSNKSSSAFSKSSATAGVSGRQGQIPKYLLLAAANF